MTVRRVPDAATGEARLPAGTRSVAVFLVNNRQPDPDRSYTRFAFQPLLRLESPLPFVARPDLRSGDETAAGEDPDERIADVQYRDVVDYAVGHGVSATWTLAPDRSCHSVETVWIPTADVERVEPRKLKGVTLGMEALAELADGEAARRGLLPLAEAYRAWIAGQEAELSGMSASRQETTREMLAIMRLAASRIEQGIERIASDAASFEAFKLANRAMAMAARRRMWIGGKRDGSPEAMPAPTWRARGLWCERVDAVHAAAAHARPARPCHRPDLRPGTAAARRSADARRVALRNRPSTNSPAATATAGGSAPR